MTRGFGAGNADLHPDVAPLGFLLGRWAGEGEGRYPTTASFGYGEEVTFSHIGKPYLAYAQRSWSLEDGRPLHAETGYWRCSAGERVELVVAHPNGLVEISEGTLRAMSIELASTTVARTGTAKEVSLLVRAVRVEGDHLTYRIDMAAVGVDVTEHLRARLQRVSATR
jgi:THAP4-like, heme-binding beta-barrel domain